MASAQVLNHTWKAGEFSLAPFALSGSNHLSRADQFQTFAVPDIHPQAYLEEKRAEEVGGGNNAGERMSMVAGDFCVLYGPDSEEGAENKERFDAVATVFFIDTAPNIIRYVEAVKHCLKHGGVWVNLGPLLWHHVAKGPPGAEGEEGKGDGRDRDMGVAEPGSVELTDEEVVGLVEWAGFRIERHETGRVETGYMQDPRGMLVSTYRPSFWVARKVGGEGEGKAEG
jgi:hypothetical protein